jgi:malonate-semialdehyde dehydrogenase (acetylating)/methylmalonate-semialdehyde dehydrogenase
MTYVVPHFINGQRVDSEAGTRSKIYNPALGDVIGELVFAEKPQIEQAVASAKKAFATWSLVPPLQRARIFFKLKTLLEKHSDEMAEIVTREHGKIISDAKGSVQRAIEVIELMCGIPYLLKGSFSENVSNHIDSYTVRQPLGVCLGITPFNFPVMIPAWMFAPAIACGNTFILKPSEKDPSPSLFLAELLQEAGLPDGVFNVLQGGKETVEHLLTHPDIAAVSCVGSTPVAQHVYKTAIQNGKRAHTFGGAKNHCVIMPDADLDEAANAICNAAYGSAGERCMAISAALPIGSETARKLIEKIREKISQIKIGPGSDAKNDMGPLITQEHLERVKRLVGVGVKEGAKLIVDGRECAVLNHKKGFFMGPCLFDQVTTDMQIYREEIFGPVLTIVRTENFEDALKIINDNEYGNGTAIFTKSGEAGREFASRVQVGMVGINIPIPVPVAYHTFGGWKHSVFGDIHMHSDESVKFYTRSKTITARWPKMENLETYHMPHH